MRPAEHTEVEHWDELVAACGSAASVLQGRAFAEVKAAAGWKPQYYLADKLPVLVLQRKVPGFGIINYVPGGPMVQSLGQLEPILAELHKLSGFVVQAEPELAAEAGVLQDFARRQGLMLAPGIQPNHSTVIVDLTPEEGAILAGFHSKTRYNIGLSTRKGVTAEPVPVNADNMEQMYRLMSSSQERGGYFLRPKAYFETAWKANAARRSGQLFFAKYEGQTLAGVFATYIGESALYKDGGSTREHREAQAMSLLQWEVMRWLKSQGVKHYDLDGVPPADRLDDPTHPFAGLARFKTGFSSEVVTRVGVLELPLNGAKYRLWKQGGERVYGAALYRLRGQSLY